MAQCKFVSAIGTTSNTYPDNSTNYSTVAGILLVSATEAYAQSSISKLAGTVSNLKTYASANTTLVTTTITTRKNSADTSLTVNYTSGQTGQKEDTSNSFSVAADDLLAHKVVVANDASGATLITMHSFVVDFTPTNDYAALSIFQLVTSNGTNFSTASSQNYANGCGRVNTTTTTEANAKYRISSDYTASNIRGVVSANARTTTTTLKSRKNGADGAQSTTWTSGQTGTKQDTTNTDSLTNGDDFNFVLALGTGTGNITVHDLSVALVSNIGRFIHLNSNGAGKSVTAVVYTPIHGGGNASEDTGTENNIKVEAGFTCVATNMSTYVSSNSSAVNATAEFRVNNANSALAVTYTAGQTGLKQDTDTVTVTGETDYINWRMTENGAGTVVYRWLGVEYYTSHTVEGDGSSSGTGTASGVGAAIGASEGASSGTGDASGVSSAISPGVGSSSGVGTGAGDSATLTIQEGLGFSSGLGVATGYAGYTTHYRDWNGIRTNVAVGEIDAAVLAATPGTILVLAPGTHELTEDIPEQVTLRSAGCGRDTVLECSNITLMDSATIRDLTIRSSGAAFNPSSTCWFENCIFECKAMSNGPDVGNTVTFNRCTFRHVYVEDSTLVVINDDAEGEVQFFSCVFRDEGLETICIHAWDFNVTGASLTLNGCTFVLESSDSTAVDTELNVGRTITYTNNVCYYPPGSSDNFGGDANGHDVGSGNWAQSTATSPYAYVTNVKNLDLDVTTGALRNGSPARNAVTPTLTLGRDYLPYETAGSAGAFQWQAESSMIYRPWFLDPMDGFVFGYEPGTSPATITTENETSGATIVRSNHEVACIVRKFVHDLIHPSRGDFYTTWDGYYNLVSYYFEFDLNISGIASLLFGEHTYLNTLETS